MARRSDEKGNKKPAKAPAPRRASRYDRTTAHHRSIAVEIRRVLARIRKRERQLLRQGVPPATVSLQLDGLHQHLATLNHQLQNVA